MTKARTKTMSTTLQQNAEHPIARIAIILLAVLGLVYVTLGSAGVLLSLFLLGVAGGVGFGIYQTEVKD